MAGLWPLPVTTGVRRFWMRQSFIGGHPDRGRTPSVSFSRVTSLASLALAKAEPDHPPEAPVADIDAIAVHHRTGAGDYTQSTVAAKGNRRWRDARSPGERLMHPDAAYAACNAIASDLLGDFRSGRNDNAIDAAWN
ncbi:MAG TPA: hypothetical protein VEH77_06835 [Roseiarcus sp.]|nr:hypothetical protein [Roseiarcus sp.]